MRGRRAHTRLGRRADRSAGGSAGLSRARRDRAQVQVRDARGRAGSEQIVDATVDARSVDQNFERAERVLAAGLMGLTPAGAFEPWRPVGGREAIDVVDAVARLAGP